MPGVTRRDANIIARDARAKLTEQDLDAAFGPQHPTDTAKPEQPKDHHELYPPEPASSGVAVAQAYRPLYPNLSTALCAIQAKLPEVIKGKLAKVEKDGALKYTYRYADLADVSKAILPLMSQVGISFRAKPTTNAAGHFGLDYVFAHVSDEEDRGFWPLSNNLKIQEIGSAITYARRYVLCSWTGLVAEEDEDATSVNQRAVNELDRSPMPRTLARTLDDDLSRADVATMVRLWRYVEAFHAQTMPAGENDLTWAQVFSGRLVRLIADVKTPDQGRELYGVLKSLADSPETSAMLSAWSFGGLHPGELLKRRAGEIRDLAQQARTVLEHAIESAETEDQLQTAHLALRKAVDEHRIHQPEIGELEKLVLAQAARMTPEGVHNPPEPVAQESVVVLHAKYWNFREAIWSGAMSVAQVDELLGAFEREELTNDEHALLHAMLTERPNVPDVHSDPFVVVSWLDWQIEQAGSAPELDDVKARVQSGAINGVKLTVSEARKLYAAISARRQQLNQVG